MNDIVWVVGKTIRQTDDGGVWELQGVFSSEEIAEEIAYTGGYWLGPVPMNKPLPNKTTSWPGQRWPRKLFDELMRGLKEVKEMDNNA